MRLFVATILAAAAASCIAGSGATVCENGIVCPRGTVCDLANTSCVPEGKQAACDGRQNGEPCEFLGVAGVCGDGICNTEVCGNGVVDPDEECDCGDGTFLPAGCISRNADEAAASCRLDCIAHCGDGVQNELEECDVGAPADGACVDFGFDRGALGCEASCTRSFATCGDIGFKENQLPAFLDTYSVVARAPEGELFVAGSVFGTAVVSTFKDGQWARAEVGPGVISDVVAVSSTEAYAVGTGGRAWQYDGSEWTSLPTDVAGTDNRGALATEAGLLVASSSGIRRFDGAWNLEQAPIAPAGSYVAIGGRYPDAVFAASNSCPFCIVIQRRPSGGWPDGDTRLWRLAPGLDVGASEVLDFATVGSSVFAVGTGGLVARYDGQWTVLAAPTSSDLISAWGSEASGLFAATAEGDIFHFADGWSPLELGFDDSRQIVDVNGSADRVAVLTRSSSLGPSVFEAASDHFSTVATVAQRVGSAPITAFYQVSASKVFFVGPDGLALVHDGLSFSDISLDPTVQLSGIWARSGDDVYASGQRAGSPVLFHFDGIGWEERTSALPTAILEAASLTMVGRGDEALFVGSAGVVLRLKAGDVFTDLSNPFLADAGVGVGRLTADGPITLHFVGGQFVAYHHDGAKWNRLVAFDVLPSAFFASSATDIFLGDFGGVIYHWNGTTINATTATGQIGAIDGTSGSDVFAVTVGRTVLHFDGTAWAPVQAPRLAYTGIHVLPASVQFLDFFGDTVRLLRSGAW